MIFLKNNQAPYMLNFHTNWFLVEEQRLGLKNFIAWAMQEQNNYFVSITEMLLWLTSSELDKKPETLPEPNIQLCTNPVTCETTHQVAPNTTEFRYMRACINECPIQYPWLL